MTCKRAGYSAKIARSIGTENLTKPDIQKYIAELIKTRGNMKNNGFTINAKLPSLNEYINACRANRYKGAKLKEYTETIIAYGITQARASGTLRTPKPPIRVVFVWHEKTRRRDADNIASAKKFILDAMQHCGIIPNDNRANVVGFTDEIVDDINDFVEVRIIEVTA